MHFGRERRIAADHRQIKDSTSRLHAWNISKPMAKFVEKARPLVAISVFCLRRLQTKSEDIHRVKAGRYPRNSPNGPHHQPSAGQEHQRQRHFTHDQETAKTIVAHALAGAAFALFEGLRQLGA